MIWYVHRREGGSIASAHEAPEPGYAEEALDDEKDAEMIAYRAAVTAQIERTPEQKLAAAGLSVADLRKMLGLQ